MSDSLPTKLPEPFINAEGSLQCGATLIEPWPSLRMTPGRDLACVQKILWAKPGDTIWPFTEQIPEEVLKVIKCIPAFSWRLLELVTALPRCGTSLLIECPALAVLIVRAPAQRRGDRTEEYRDLLALKWRDILNRLSLPGSHQIVRILRKIPASHCQPLSVETLAEALRTKHPHVRLLSHLSKITSDTIALLRAAPGKVSPHLLLASTTSGPGEHNIAWCLEVVSWFHEKERRGQPWPYGGLNAQELARVQATYLNHAHDEDEGSTVFPPPPVAGIPGQITPLTDASAVFAEGDELSNCAGSFVAEIVRGQCFLYAVTIKERATLALRRNLDGYWVVEDLRAVNNQAVSRETEVMVTAWLANETKERSTP